MIENDLSAGRAGAKRGSIVLIAMAVYIVCLLPYLQTASFGYIHFDDPLYSTGNSMVRRGITLEGVERAISSNYHSYIHPLTWLSHMVDVELFGLNAGGPHVLNSLLHGANAALVFALFFASSGRLWPSILTALFFGLHPLRVESVAWISERKGVLSAFFCLIALNLYVQSIRKRRVGMYAATFLSFVLALLAKPSAVMLPVAMLLLDVWPLERLKISKLDPRSLIGSLGKLVFEKLPFFAMSAFWGGVTILLTSKNATVRIEDLSVSQRLVTAVVNYADYLKLIAWPDQLSIFHPFKTNPGWTEILASAVVLISITALCIYAARRDRPSSLSGWLWFLLLLLPVSGLVQSGAQSISERYAYLPSIGLTAAIVWFGARTLDRFQVAFRVRGTLLALTLVLLAWRTYEAVRVWGSEEELWKKSVEIESSNFVAQSHVASRHLSAGRTKEAESSARQAIKAHPGMVTSYLGLAAAEQAAGRSDDAIKTLQYFLTTFPFDPAANVGLADIYTSRSEPNKARTLLFRAIQAEPDSEQVNLRLAKLMEEMKDGKKALKYARNAAAADPASEESCALYWRLLKRDLGYAEAFSEFNRILKPNRNETTCLVAAGKTDMASGDFKSALVHFSHASQLASRKKEAQILEAKALLHLGRIEEGMGLLEIVVPDEMEKSRLLLVTGWSIVQSATPEHARMAEELIRATVTYSPQDEAFARLVLGSGLAAQGNFEQAITELTMVQQQPQSEEFTHMVNFAIDKFKKREVLNQQALAEYRKAIKPPPKP